MCNKDTQLKCAQGPFGTPVTYTPVTCTIVAYTPKVTATCVLEDSKSRVLSMFTRLVTTFTGRGHQPAFSQNLSVRTYAAKGEQYTQFKYFCYGTHWQGPPAIQGLQTSMPLQ